jgi:hypothetical protein
VAVITYRQRAIGWIGGAAVLVVSLAGCASQPGSGPRQMKPEDFKWLAGEWLGSGYTQGDAPMNLRGVIYENGAFFIAPRGSSGAQLPGQMKVVDGEVLYETSTSQGKMTFQDTGTEWLWQWQGKQKIGGAT